MNIIPLLLAYFLGSIPFGLLLTRMAGLGDIRKFGSGNIGATNVMRTGHKGLGAMTLLLDMAKGALGVWLVFQFDSPIGTGILISPLVVVLGHVFPLWLKFKGGKGVATAIGAITMFFFPMGLAIIITWIIVFYILRTSSLAALASIWIGPTIMIAYLCYAPSLETEKMAAIPLSLVFIPVALLITITHRANIKRLIQGTEPRFKRKGS